MVKERYFKGLRELEEGELDEDELEGAALAARDEYYKNPSLRLVEKEFWNIIDRRFRICYVSSARRNSYICISRTREVEVLYGSDLDAKEFAPWFEESESPGLGIRPQIFPYL